MFDMGERALKRMLNKVTFDKASRFRAVFLPSDGQPTRDSERVLAHLRQYCRAEGSTYHPEALEMARREGRREVWLEINRLLQLDDAEIRRLRTVEEDHYE